MNTDHEFLLSEKNLSFFKKTANDYCGIDLSDYKKDFLYNRLVRRLRMLHMTDFDQYCTAIKNDSEEEKKFINLITNTSTSFFREEHHFEYLAQTLLPELISKKNKIRIWSAGCATGEEAYSIAMVIREVIPNLSQYDIKILATDINSESLDIAYKGIYDSVHIKKLTAARQKMWFHQDRVDDKLKELITFRQLNLIHPFLLKGPFDVIFCRNVTIYFKKEVTCDILKKFNNLLPHSGILILGFSENLYDLKEDYNILGHTIFKKI